MSSFYLRHPDVGVVAQDDKCVFVLGGRAPFVLTPCDPSAISKALTMLSTPRELGEIEDLVDLRVLTVLSARGYVLSSTNRAELDAALGPAHAPTRRCRHLVLGVTGAIGAVNTVPLASALHRHFAARMDVVLTQAACRIVQPDVYRYLGIEPWTDTFEPRSGGNVPHIALAAADLVVIAPASAHTLYKLAHGACSDLLSLVVAATRAPVVVAPSMNGAMWEDPAIADNVALLRKRGFWIVEPTLGIEVSRGQNASWEAGAASLDPTAWLPMLESILPADAR